MSVLRPQFSARVKFRIIVACIGLKFVKKSRPYVSFSIFQFEGVEVIPADIADHVVYARHEGTHNCPNMMLQ